MVNTKKHLRTCSMCKGEYLYCNNCAEYQHMEPWHLRWCSESCKEADNVLCNFEAGLVSAKEAANILKSLDTSKMENWGDGYKATYAKIMKAVSGDAKPADPEHVEEPVSVEEPAPEPLSIAEEVKNSSKKRTTKSRAPREKN